MSNPRVLILGCSFSMGSYGALDSKNDQVVSNYCWYNELPKDYIYDVYTTAGGSYLNYASLLWNNVQTSIYHAIIIQETTQARFLILNEPKYICYSDYENVNVYKPYKEMKVYRNNMKGTELKNWEEKYNMKVTPELQFFFNDFDTSKSIRLIGNAMSEYVDRLCKQTKKPTLAFSLNRPGRTTPKHEYIRRLDDSFREVIWGNDKYQVNPPYGHFNEEGNKLIGKELCQQITSLI